jgi:hypothetical protein
LACDWCGQFEPCQRATPDSAAQTRHVCAGSAISTEADQGSARSPAAQGGPWAAVGTPPP